MHAKLPVLAVALAFGACNERATREGSAAPSASASTAVTSPPGFSLTSPDIESRPGCGPGGEAAACGFFKTDNTRMGADVSPAFVWERPPPATRSYAIALHDLSNLHDGDPFTHWVMWNIPGSQTQLPARLPASKEPGVPAAATRQTSFRSDQAYTGSGACGNVYEIVLYALDAVSFEPTTPDSADKVEAELITAKSLLGTASLRARCNPDGPCQQIHR
jgi:phosphatidylethanolamine-binding protein (PEBP) family uncharacterized protein